MPKAAFLALLFERSAAELAPAVRSDALDNRWLCAVTKVGKELPPNFVLASDCCFRKYSQVKREKSSLIITM